MHATVTSERDHLCSFTDDDNGQPRGVFRTRRQRARRSAARIASWLAVAAGTVNLLSAAFPAERARLRVLDQLLPGSVTSAALVFTVATGIALLLLAGGLRRRKHVAWVSTVILLIGSCFLHYFKGLDIEEAMIEAFMAGYLIDKRHEFNAKSNPREHLSVLWPGLLVVLSTVIYGVLGLSVRGNDVDSFGTLGERLVMTARMAVGLGLPKGQAHRFGEHFALTVAALFYVGAMFVLVRLLAPVLRKRDTQPITCEEARGSSDSLAWFARRDDREIVRAPRGAVAYGSIGSVALASGDPFGEMQDWPETVDTFLDAVRSNGQIPAVIGCGAVAASVYREAGLVVMYMGDEAILDLRDFSVDRKGMKIARQSWNRAKRARFTAIMRRGNELDQTMVAKLSQLSHQWRGDAAERGFSMTLGRLFDDRDADSVFAIALDAEETPVGFIHFVPWGRDGLSLDVMRRTKSSPAILNDFLIVECCLQAPRVGIQRISLNFSFLRAIVADAATSSAATQEAIANPKGELDAHVRETRLASRLSAMRTIVSSPGLRLTRWILRRLSGRFQIASLYRFNKKFMPTWQPRYFALEGPEDAPRVLFSALRAEGLISLPRMRDERRDEPRGEAQDER